MPDDGQTVHDAVRQRLLDVARRGTTITYEDLLDQLPAAARVDVERDMASILRRISIEADEAGEGLMSAVVVRRTGGLPGTGFFRLAAERGRDVTDHAVMWRAEWERVVAARAQAG